MYTDRTNVNSLFGTFTVDRATGLADITNINDDAIYDKILRDPEYKNIEQDILSAGIKLNMKIAPRVYINEKNADLADISVKLRNIFRSKMALYMSYGFSQKESEAKAKAATKQEEMELMKLHKFKFPKDVEQLNIFQNKF